MDRCTWVGIDKIYQDYHDTEWGVPEYDSRALWEKLILDGFQAGLSWITILKKRPDFRSAFAGFDPEEIAGWGAAEVDLLLQNPGIVRHRGKIGATLATRRPICIWPKRCPSRKGCGPMWMGARLLVAMRQWRKSPPNPRSVRRSREISKRPGSNFVARPSFMPGWRLVVCLTITF